MSPPLGSYYFLLQSQQKNKKKNKISIGNTLFPNILSELKQDGEKILKIQHESDRRFFNYAMEISKQLPMVANTLYDIIENGQHLDLVRPSDFYSHYISAIAVQTTDWDTIHQKYNDYFQNRYVPPLCCL